jgi:hypothetical protein
MHNGQIKPLGRCRATTSVNATPGLVEKSLSYGLIRVGAFSVRLCRLEGGSKSPLDCMCSLELCWYRNHGHTYEVHLYPNPRPCFEEDQKESTEGIHVTS